MCDGMDTGKLPAEILRHFDKDTEIKENTTGRSEARVYRCVSPVKTLYLKTGPKNKGLKKECQNILWLRGRSPVPDIVEWVSWGGYDYLLVSEIPGKMLCDAYYLRNAELAVSVLAEGIRLLHSIDITDCPLNNNLDIKLRDAAMNIKDNRVERGCWESSAGRFSSPGDLFGYLAENRPAKEELVFTHGDYCLPNVFGEGSLVRGFIDLGRAGIADKWQDIALCIRSLRYNFHTERYDGLLLDRMGIPNNTEKLEYYTLLDELF
jgi:kanamycin kinase/aminoglycoside 3'-phosphotransferase-3